MDKSFNLSEKQIEQYKKWLTEEEKSSNTISKYIRDIEAFYKFISVHNYRHSQINKIVVMEFKRKLQERYAPSSVNSMLVAVNGFLQHIGMGECCVKLLKRQRRIFREEERELTKAEYIRLITAAKQRKNNRLSLVIETICSTGIRVSELSFITIEAVYANRAEINCKGKCRSIFLPQKLCRRLLKYAKRNNITSGCIFRTKGGKPLDRSNIWHDMKGLCKNAKVQTTKVFPHNLRHLFARTFYRIEKDIVHLADILGHSSVETTRIYTISSGIEHAREVERLGLVV